MYRIATKQITFEKPDIERSLACIIFKKGKYWLYHNQDFSQADMITNPSSQIWLPLSNPNPNIFKDRVTSKYYL
jgi:hypothetical protein